MSVKRNLLAALLIFGIFLLIPKYLEMVGVSPELNCYIPSGDVALVLTEEECVGLGGRLDSPYIKETGLVEKGDESVVSTTPKNLGGEKQSVLTIQTDVYRAVLSNEGGGSIVKYELIK